MNSAMIMSEPNTMMMVLPRIATIALAVTPGGLLMRTMYFFIDRVREPIDD